MTSLEESSFSSGLLDAVINKNWHKDEYTAANKLLDSDVAKMFFRVFEIGDQKVVLYGNPIVMSTKSKLFANMLEQAIKEVGSGTLLLAPGLSLEPYPESFLSVWLFMNGITTDYLIDHTFKPEASQKEQRYKILGRMLRIWDWIKYFDLEKGDKFIDYISAVGHDVWFYLLDLAPELKEDKTIKSIEFPKEFLPNIKDLDEEIRSLVADDAVTVEAGAGDINIRSLFDFILGKTKEFKLSDVMLETDADYPFGYPSREEIQRLAEEEKKRQISDTYTGVGRGSGLITHGFGGLYPSISVADLSALQIPMNNTMAGFRNEDFDGDNPDPANQLD